MNFKHNMSVWHLAVAVLSAAVLSACSHDGIDTPEPQGAGAIAFTPSAGTRAASTRAAALTKDDVTDFAVTALYNREGNDLTARAFSDQYVVKAGNSWQYEPAQYWPSDSATKIRFFALAPFNIDYNTTTVTATDGSVKGVSASFAVPADHAAQQDLLYAVTGPLNNAYDAGGASAATVDPVPLTFKHATAQISFKVQMANDVNEKYTAQVSRISLYTLGSGTVLLDPSGAATWTVERDFRSGAAFSALTQYHLTPGNGLLAANGSYTDGSATVPTYNIATAARETDSGAGKGPRNAAAAPNGTPVLITKPTANADNPAGYLFLIPQQPPIISLTKPSQLVEPTLNITYRLDNGLTGDEWLYTDKSVSFSLTDLAVARSGSGSGYKDLTQPEDGTTDTPDWPWIWEPGKAYCYVITISTTDVTLNILPTDWIDGNSGNYDYEFK